MREMYEFLAFNDALNNGLSTDALIEDHAQKGKVQLENSLNRIVSELQELVLADEEKREELLKEARELAPTEAQTYSAQLAQRVKDLKEIVNKQEAEFESAEAIAKQLKMQNTETAASVDRLKGMIKQQQDKNSRLLNEVYAAGAGLCQYTANPNQRNGHECKYSRSYGSKSASSNF